MKVGKLSKRDRDRERERMRGAKRLYVIYSQAGCTCLTTDIQQPQLLLLLLLFILSYWSAQMKMRHFSLQPDTSTHYIHFPLYYLNLCQPFMQSLFYIHNLTCIRFRLHPPGKTSLSLILIYQQKFHLIIMSTSIPVLTRVQTSEVF